MPHNRDRKIDERYVQSWNSFIIFSFCLTLIRSDTRISVLKSHVYALVVIMLSRTVYWRIILFVQTSRFPGASGPRKNSVSSACTRKRGSLFIISSSFTSCAGLLLHCVDYVLNVLNVLNAASITIGQSFGRDAYTENSRTIFNYTCHKRGDV